MKPSERFINVLLPKLGEEGFTFKKSKNQFVQEFEHGKRIISLSFISTAGIVSVVQFFYIIIFTKLEDQFKKIFPKYGWTNWTIAYSLNYSQNWLYDKSRQEHTDESIKKVADEFFEKFKPQIDGLRDKFKDYTSLHLDYNKEPIGQFEYLPGRVEKRIINGLILAKWLEPNAYERLKKEYLGYFESYNGEDKEELKSEIETGLRYLDNYL